MARTRIATARAELHHHLYGLVGQDICEPGSPTPPSLAYAKDLILKSCDLEREPTTGLKHYVRREKEADWLVPHRQFTEGYFQLFWPPGQLMLRTLLKEPHASLIRGKRVVSIGSGGGLAEICLAKTRKPELMVCLESDVFARAMITLNAEANGIKAGGNFVVMSHTDVLKPVTLAGQNLRLFDTAITADILYGGLGPRAREVKQIVGGLRNLNGQGVNVIIAERDYRQFYLDRGDRVRADSHGDFQRQSGLLPNRMIASAKMPLDNTALHRVHLHANNAKEPANVYLLSGSLSKQPLPRLGTKWWQPPATTNQLSRA